MMWKKRREVTNKLLVGGTTCTLAQYKMSTWCHSYQFSNKWYNGFETAMLIAIFVSKRKQTTELVKLRSRLDSFNAHCTDSYYIDKESFHHILSLMRVTSIFIWSSDIEPSCGNIVFKRERERNCKILQQLEIVYYEQNTEMITFNMKAILNEETPTKLLLVALRNNGFSFGMKYVKWSRNIWLKIYWCSIVQKM